MIERLVFGCASLSSLACTGEVFRLLDAVLQTGIRHFDTARAYGNGYSEKLLGEFIRSNRTEITVTTKVGLGKLATSRIPARLALPLNFIAKKITGNPRQHTPAERSSGEKQGKPDFPALPLSVVERSLDESIRQLGKMPEILLLHENLPASLDPQGLEFLQRLQANDGCQIGIGTNAAVILQAFDAHPLVGILQYNANEPHVVAELQNKYQDRIHYHHTVLKNTHHDHSRVLREALLHNPNGKVIFSTRQPKHLLETLQLIQSDALS